MVVGKSVPGRSAGGLMLAGPPPTAAALPPEVLQVIPALSGDATDQTPPDLPSYLFKERIVYVVRAAAGQGLSGRAFRQPQPEPGWHWELPVNPWPPKLSNAPEC